MPTRIAAVIMAGGLGTRMRSQTPKHLHPLLGQRLVDWVIDAARALGADRLVVVTSPGGADAYDGRRGRRPGAAARNRRRGRDARAARSTGSTAACWSSRATRRSSRTEMLQELRRGAPPRRSGRHAALLQSPVPLPYGRIVRDADGDVARDRRGADATAEERAIEELNSSFYVFDAAALWRALEQLDADNAQGELYLTDADRARRLRRRTRGRAPRPVRSALASSASTPAPSLPQAAAVLRDRINERHMLAGVTIVDPQTTWIDAEVELEADSTVHPFTVLRGATRVAAGAEIGPHAAVLDAEIGPGALAGPFCYLRPGTVLAAGAKAGAFVEIKNTRVGERSKVPHLSYIGDADIGEDTNIGAGAITANFPHEPGRPKQRTKIGKNVRTGSPQYLRCSGRDWRRCLDRRRDRS